VRNPKYAGWGIQDKGNSELWPFDNKPAVIFKDKHKARRCARKYPLRNVTKTKGFTSEDLQEINHVFSKG